MTTTQTNQNHSELNNSNDNNGTFAITPAVPHEGKSAETIRAEKKPRTSFLTSLLRTFSAVSF